MSAEALETANAALCEEIRRLKAELHQEREANRPLRHELQQARESAGTLLAILEAVSDRLTAEEAASVARIVAKAASEKPLGAAYGANGGTGRFV